MALPSGLAFNGVTGDVTDRCIGCPGWPRLQPCVGTPGRPDAGRVLLPARAVSGCRCDVRPRNGLGEAQGDVRDYGVRRRAGRLAGGAGWSPASGVPGLRLLRDRRHPERRGSGDGAAGADGSVDRQPDAPSCAGRRASWIACWTPGVEAGGEQGGSAGPAPGPLRGHAPSVIPAGRRMARRRSVTPIPHRLRRPDGGGTTGSWNYEALRAELQGKATPLPRKPTPR